MIRAIRHSSVTLAKVLATTLLALGIACCGMVAAPAQADDGVMPVSGHNDSPCDFNFYLYTADYSGAEQKYESSPVFLYVYDMGGVVSCTLQAQGSNDTTYWSNQAVGGNIYFYQGIGTYDIHSYIYENGYQYARIGALKIDSSGHMYGYWSPDSYGGHTSLN